MSETGENDLVVGEAAEWLRRGEELRRRLEAERSQLLVRVKEIEKILEQMPPSPMSVRGAKSSGVKLSPIVESATPATPVARSAMTKFRDAAAPDVVRHILATHRNGLSAADVQSMAREIQSSIEPSLVSSALARSPGIRREGKRGSMLYFPEDREVKAD